MWLLTLSRVFEGRVEVVYHLCEHVGNLLVAILVDKSYADAPFTHGEFLHGRRFVTKSSLEMNYMRAASQQCSRRKPNRVGCGWLYLHDMLLRDDLERSLEIFVSWLFLSCNSCRDGFDAILLLLDWGLLQGRFCYGL